MNFKVRNCRECFNLVLLFLFICSSAYEAHGKNLKAQLEEFKQSALEDSESKDGPDSSASTPSPSSSSSSTDPSTLDLNSGSGFGSKSDSEPGCPGNAKSINPTTGKCIEVLPNDVLPYASAKSVCRRRKSSDGSIVYSLLTIDSEEEQKEVTQLLFNSLAIPDNVWLDSYRRFKGDENSDTNQGFKWFDGRRMGYSNWRQGAPSESLSNKCVQMVSPGGQWVDVNCHVKNIAVCQSVRRVTLESLQSTFLGFRKTVKAKLEENERLLNETRKLVADLTVKVQKQEQEQQKQLKQQKEEQEKAQEQKPEEEQAQKEKQQEMEQQQKQQQADTVKNQNTVSVTNVKEVCKDKSPYCAAMEPGQCEDAKQGVWFRVMCRKACGQCDTPEFSGCVDKDEKCSMWGKAGECGRNPNFMKDICQKTCGVCS